MRTVKTLIMESTSIENGAIGSFWMPKVEVWNVETGELNIVVRLFASELAFTGNLKPLETKIFREVVLDWNGKSIEEFAFDLIKKDEFFVTAVESYIVL